MQAHSVVGHSSGEIAAAYAAGLITREEAIKIAYFRGKAATECPNKTAVGMLAVGLGSDQVQKYLAGLERLVQIACYNSPDSVTLSGELEKLKEVKFQLDQDGHFARLLHVDLAYHSTFMADIGKHYEELLRQHCEDPVRGNGRISMFSSVSGNLLNRSCDASYWTTNATHPVRFEQAVRAMVSESDAPDFLIELGPSGALAGPITQIKKSLSSKGIDFQYCAASSRGKDSVKALFDVIGRLSLSSDSINIAKVNMEDPSLTSRCAAFSHHRSSKL